MKKLLVVLGILAAIVGVLRYRQVQEQRRIEAEVWAEATDPV